MEEARSHRVSLADVIGILAFATNVWANLLIARKSEFGWIVRLAANVFWLMSGIWMNSVAIILNSVVFAGINIYGLRKWRRERLVSWPTKCEDHYKITCTYCREIIRQCRCLPHGDKPTTQSVCGVCLKMMPPSLESAA